MSTTPEMTLRFFPRGHKKAGAFSTWLRHHQRKVNAIAEGNAAKAVAEVPCGECNACCRCGYTVEVKPDDDSTLETVADPEHPGQRILRRNEDGSCFHLVEGRCSVYAKRPAACRQYDCRSMVYAGLVPGAYPILQKACEQWDPVSFVNTKDDKVLLAAYRLAVLQQYSRGLDVEAACATALFHIGDFIDVAKQGLRLVESNPKAFRAELQRQLARAASTADENS